MASSPLFPPRSPSPPATPLRESRPARRLEGMEKSGCLASLSLFSLEKAAHRGPPNEAEEKNEKADREFQTLSIFHSSSSISLFLARSLYPPLSLNISLRASPIVDRELTTMSTVAALRFTSSTAASCCPRRAASSSKASSSSSSLTAAIRGRSSLASRVSRVSNGTRCTAFFKFNNPLRENAETAGE